LEEGRKEKGYQPCSCDPHHDPYDHREAANGEEPPIEVQHRELDETHGNDVPELHHKQNLIPVSMHKLTGAYMASTLRNTVTVSLLNSSNGTPKPPMATPTILVIANATEKNYNGDELGPCHIP